MKIRECQVVFLLACGKVCVICCVARDRPSPYVTCVICCVARDGPSPYVTGAGWDMVSALGPSLYR